MIPTPPLTDDGELAVNRWTLLVNIVGGILSPCCACRHTSATYWHREGRYVPLHERCVDHLISEWRMLIEQGQASIPEPTGRQMGAYARRAASRAPSGTAPVLTRTASVSLGSPYFIPGMPEGTPWTAVAEMPDGIPLITPCGPQEDYARKVNGTRRAATALGQRCGSAGQVPLGGYVVDPTGARSDEWSATELNSRDSSAKLAG